MLVVARKKQESVVILLPDGRQVRVWNLGVPRGLGEVRLGIEAPGDVNIRRGEIPPREEQPCPQPLT